MFPLNMVIPAAGINNKLVSGVYIAYIIVMSFVLASVWEADVQPSASNCSYEVYYL